MVAEDEATIDRLALLSRRSERRCWWSGTTRRRSTRRSCIHELFEGRRRRTPDAVAVVFEERRS